MEIPQTEVSKHWNYFLMLEDDLSKISRYVEFSEDNYDTYSLEISRLLVSACGEADGIFKELCARLDPTGSYKNIDNYRNLLLQACKELPSKEITIPRFGLKITPFSNWGKEEPDNPLWWRGHNGIKHNRRDQFRDGNLKNAINALAGLYVLILYLHFYEDNFETLFPNPQLFFPESFYNGETFERGHFRYDTHGFD